MKRHPTFFLVLALLLLCAIPVIGDSQLPDGIGKLSNADRAVLDRGIGQRDPGYSHTVATKLSATSLIAAFYEEHRGRRQVAMHAVGNMMDPWPLMDYLVAFMGARQHAVASAAAQSLEKALDSIQRSTVKGALEAPKGQIEQLNQQLLELVEKTEVERDIRVVGLRAVESLALLVKMENPVDLDLIEDPDPIIRSHILATLSIPLNEKNLQAVGRIAVDDENVFLRGQAVGRLCENALQLQVKRPSEDLAELMEKLLEEQEHIDALATTLGCLAAIPYESRTALTDRIVTHPRSEVQALWKSLTATSK